MKINQFRQIDAQGGNIIPAKAFSRKQAVFNEKAAQYASQGVITTPGYLRLETLAPYNTATSNISFNTLDTSGVKTCTERRLKLNDTFTITDISFYLGSGTSGAAGATPTPAEYAVQALNTFPNPNVPAFAGNFDDLEALYNGFLSLRIDTTTFLDSIPMKQFYRVATSQFGVGSATAAIAVQANEWPLSMYGRTELLPTIELNGQSNIEFSITLPNATNLSPTSTKFTNMVLILQGFLNQGASTVQRRVAQRLR
jgi:hypothetical protein